jgi:hypothetical protein
MSTLQLHLQINLGVGYHFVITTATLMSTGKGMKRKCTETLRTSLHHAGLGLRPKFRKIMFMIEIIGSRQARLVG